jgi:hypothetical protein
VQSLLDGGEILLVFKNCTQVVLLVVMRLGVGWQKFLHHLHEEMRVEEQLCIALLELGEELRQSRLVCLSNGLSDICHILVDLLCRLKAQLVTLGRASVEFFVFFDGLLFFVVWLFSFFKCVLDLAEKARYCGERFVGKLLELLLCGIE